MIEDTVYMNELPTLTKCIFEQGDIFQSEEDIYLIFTSHPIINQKYEETQI